MSLFRLVAVVHTPPEDYGAAVLGRFRSVDFKVSGPGWVVCSVEFINVHVGQMIISCLNNVVRVRIPFPRCDTSIF